MSANRANASARNRRAGGAEIAPQQQQTGRGGQNQKVTQEQNPKISISDAIGLVTLRLGRLESFMYTINHEGLPSSENLGLEENDRIVDDEVFQSIVSRLDVLEQKINSLSTANTQDTSIENQPLIKTILEKQTAHQLSVYELKDTILKLQTFSLENGERIKKFIEQSELDKNMYNEKIKELTDKYESIQESSVNNSNEEDSDNDSGDDVVEVLEDNTINSNTINLKELIKKELLSENNS
uniref:Uncharacterized protein n=1 Tax=viral metagenome TaxID=1070528 RepID=A0A6C0KVH3_9ZZZZ